MPSVEGQRYKTYFIFARHIQYKSFYGFQIQTTWVSLNNNIIKYIELSLLSYYSIVRILGILTINLKYKIDLLSFIKPNSFVSPSLKSLHYNIYIVIA